jgi:hypothetical protein
MLLYSFLGKQCTIRHVRLTSSPPLWAWRNLCIAPNLVNPIKCCVICEQLLLNRDKGSQNSALNPSKRCTTSFMNAPNPSNLNCSLKNFSLLPWQVSHLNVVMQFHCLFPSIYPIVDFSTPNWWHNGKIFDKQTRHASRRVLCKRSNVDDRQS